MAKMNRKDAAERITEMLSGFETVTKDAGTSFEETYYKMSKEEYEALMEEIKMNSVKELREMIEKYSGGSKSGDVTHEQIRTHGSIYAKIIIADEDEETAAETQTEEPTAETQTEEPAEAPKPRSAYADTVKQLEDLFDKFNDHLFNGEVEQPVIAVMHDSTKSAYGWCTTQKIWKSDSCEYYEINICAEHLNRPIKEVCATLIHEMVHLDNIKKEIRDTSAGGRYHNKKFKETAEAHGLVIEKMQGYGWTKTSLNEATAAWIDENVKIEKFDIARASRSEIAKGKSGTTHAKYNYYKCPCCGKKFYSIYQINATCEDCCEPFEQYK